MFLKTTNKFQIFDFKLVISTTWLLVFNVGHVEYRAVYGFKKDQKCLNDAN